MASSAAYIRAHLPTGFTVQLVTDPAADNQDAYGRLLRYVILPGDAGSLNAALVRLGLTRAHRQFPHTQRPAFLEYEAAARPSAAACGPPVL